MLVDVSGELKEGQGAPNSLDIGCSTFDDDPYGINHRLTKPKTPQTNGMAERFNGRIDQVLRSHRFLDADDLAATLHRYIWLYNEHLPQKALNHENPISGPQTLAFNASALFSSECAQSSGT